MAWQHSLRKQKKRILMRCCGIKGIDDIDNAIFLATYRNVLALLLSGFVASSNILPFSDNENPLSDRVDLLARSPFEPLARTAGNMEVFTTYIHLKPGIPFRGIRFFHAAFLAAPAGSLRLP